MYIFLLSPCSDHSNLLVTDRVKGTLGVRVGEAEIRGRWRKREEDSLKKGAITERHRLVLTLSAGAQDSYAREAKEQIYEA